METYIVFDGGEEGGVMLFKRHCPQCGRYFAPDKQISVRSALNEGVQFGDTNATCKRCGRITMGFEGFF